MPRVAGKAHKAAISGRGQARGMTNAMIYKHSSDKARRRRRDPPGPQGKQWVRLLAAPRDTAGGWEQPQLQLPKARRPGSDNSAQIKGNRNGPEIKRIWSTPIPPHGRPQRAARARAQRRSGRGFLARLNPRDFIDYEDKSVEERLALKKAWSGAQPLHGGKPHGGGPQPRGRRTPRWARPGATVVGTQCWQE